MQYCGEKNLTIWHMSVLFFCLFTVLSHCSIRRSQKQKIIDLCKVTVNSLSLEISMVKHFLTVQGECCYHGFGRNKRLFHWIWITRKYLWQAASVGELAWSLEGCFSDKPQKFCPKNLLSISDESQLSASCSFSSRHLEKVGWSGQKISHR